MPRARQALVILATLLLSTQASLVLAEEETQTTCTVLVDWDVEEHWDGGETQTGVDDCWVGLV